MPKSNLLTLNTAIASIRAQITVLLDSFEESKLKIQDSITNLEKQISELDQDMKKYSLQKSNNEQLNITSKSFTLKLKDILKSINNLKKITKTYKANIFKIEKYFNTQVEKPLSTFQINNVEKAQELSPIRDELQTKINQFHYEIQTLLESIDKLHETYSNGHQSLCHLVIPNLIQQSITLSDKLTTQLSKLNQFTPEHNNSLLFSNLLGSFPKLKEEIETLQKNCEQEAQLDIKHLKLEQN